MNKIMFFLILFNSTFFFAMDKTIADDKKKHDQEYAIPHSFSPSNPNSEMRSLVIRYYEDELKNAHDELKSCGLVIGYDNPHYQKILEIKQKLASYKIGPAKL